MKYPEPWKKLCLEIMRAYRTHLTGVFGKEASWEDVRDKMMEAEDEYSITPHRGLKKLVRSSLFTRRHLETWDNGTDLGDKFFYYIDRFTRRLEIEGPIIVREKIRIYKTHANLNSLDEIYISNHKSNEFCSAVSLKLPKSLQSLSQGGSTFLYRTHSHLGLSSGIIYYNISKIYPYSSLKSDLIFCEYFLIPLKSTVSWKKDGSIDIHNKCILQVIKPEYMGTIKSGHGCSDFTITISLGRDEHIRSISISAQTMQSAVTPNNTSLAQMINDSDRDGDSHLLHKINLNNWDFTDFITVDQPSMMLKNRDIKTLNTLKNLDEICENILKVSYRGYLL